MFSGPFRVNKNGCQNKQYNNMDYAVKSDLM